MSAAKTTTDAGHRMEEFDVAGPTGTVRIRRNIDTGAQEILSGEPMQRGDRPGVGDVAARMVEDGTYPKDALPPPMPEAVVAPVEVPESHADAVTPDEVRRRSRQRAKPDGAEGTAED